MRWQPWIWQKEKGETDEALRSVQQRFTNFLSLLDANNRVLKQFSDLEEKAHGDYLFDVNYLRSALADIRVGVTAIIKAMVALGGSDYEVLHERFSLITSELAAILTGNRPVPIDAFTVPFEQLSDRRSRSVGNKSAQLGEVKSRLGLPVPDGFAITAWGYKHFLAANRLQERIDQCIEMVDFKHYDDLVWTSNKIQNLMQACKVPEDLADSIRAGTEELQRKTGKDSFALRSSAIGEDGQFSFAGQYRSLLNVRAAEVVERYLDVLAGKFTPKAISYLLSHAFRESELAMCVGCISMVDAAAAGVVYTRNPVLPESGNVLVNSVLGLGQILVDGTITPDSFCVSRQDGRIVKQNLTRQEFRLVMDAGSGTVLEPVPESEQEKPSLTADQLRELTEMALRLEEHYESPQDVEWALDREGRLFILQTRPLRVVQSGKAGEEPDVGGLEVILSGGATVCPGAGHGEVHHASSSADLPEVPDGCVLVAPRPFPGLFAVLGNISALITEVGGVASHLATLAREYGIPTIMGLPGASAIRPGRTVTVDATGATIFAGRHEELVEARRPDVGPLHEDEMMVLLKRVLAWVSPLHLLHPGDPGFTADNCRTLHDITRFCHQKSLQEMFERASGLGHRENIGLRLKTEIPLPVKMVYLDQDPADHGGKHWIGEDQIDSEPMRAFWGGIKQEGWPAPRRDRSGPALEVDPRGRSAGRGQFAEDSYAVLSREYMIVSLRMGFHFTTIEAMCSDDPNKNFIGVQVKQGGASMDRRIRRLRLITGILSALGFENASTGDFLDARISYLRSTDAAELLRLIGRLTIMTKQLDMALSNDTITEWYMKDFMSKLGLKTEGEEAS